jgi:anti-sigma B factor antagonist
MNSHTVPGELTIYTAAQEKQVLQQFLETDDELELVLSQVNEMDSAGLQILIALKTDAAQRHKNIRFVMHSKAVIDVMEMANVTAMFGDQIILT